MALTSSSSKMNLKKFDGMNFKFLKEHMQDYLILIGQMDPIDHDKAPTNYKLKDWAKLNWVAQATIRIHSSESVYSPVVYDNS
jgi:GTP-binding protein EngB required for normal cell division